MPDNVSLESLFPEFFFAAEADRFLQDLPMGSIVNQLRARRISKVKIVPMLTAGGIGIGEDNSFYVLLLDVSTLLEKAESLSHEIGHTFHFELAGKVPVDRINQAEISDEVFDRIESFCTEFSRRWLIANDRGSVVHRVKNMLHILDQFGHPLQ